MIPNECLYGSGCVITIVTAIKKAWVSVVFGACFYYKKKRLC